MKGFTTKEVPTKRRAWGQQRREVLSYVADHPGCTAYEVAEALGTTSVSNALTRLLEMKKVRYELVGDNMRHYYIVDNHKPKAASSGVAFVQPSVARTTQDVLEDAAKDFYWQTGSDSLKEFVVWRAQQ